MEKKDKVFFLGAGFSIAVAKLCNKNLIEYPSLEKLTQEVLNKFSKTSLETHLNEISPKYKENIEFLLTYLSNDLPWKTQQMKYLDKALYFEVIKKITEHFQKLDKNSSYDFEKLKILAQFIIENKLPVITLNYDTLLEKLIFSQMPERYQSSNSYRGFYKQAIVDLYSRVPQNSFGFASFDDDHNGAKLPNIYKLHGSINWLWSANNPSDPIYCSSRQENEYIRKDLAEYIIPPVLDKTLFYNHNILKSIWNDAHNCLLNAKEIYFIGFSFPVTDLSVKFLFNSVLQQTNPKIYVINTQESINPDNKHSYVVERYKEIFCSCDINFDFCREDSLLKFVNEYIELQFTSI